MSKSDMRVNLAAKSVPTYAEVFRQCCRKRFFADAQNDISVVVILNEVKDLLYVNQHL
jgi:hypothetical protein